MTRYRRPVLRTLATLAAAALLATLAQARNNPYQGIVERNAFNLKPVPPPVVETNQTAATPPVKVVLTGITSMFGPNSERVFLEMTEQAPGKAAAPPKRAMLGEGDREGDIEVLSINIEKNIVKIRNGALESELTFEVPKPGGGAPAGNVAAKTPSPTPSTPASTQPIIISSSESRGGVTMAGGGSAFQGNEAGVTSYGGSTPTTPGNFGGVSSYGGLPPTGGPGLATPSLASSRTIRTPTQSKPVDVAEQEVLMELNRVRDYEIGQRAIQVGRLPPPPLPPTRASKEIYGDAGPPSLPPFPGR